MCDWDWVRCDLDCMLMPSTTTTSLILDEIAVAAAWGEVASQPSNSLSSLLSADGAEGSSKSSMSFTSILKLSSAISCSRILTRLSLSLLRAEGEHRPGLVVGP